MNLLVNARVAVPTGGEIVVRASSARVDDDEARGMGLALGTYVRVSVTDGGVDMSAEVRARAGVPFFTTKPRELGTGLGLSRARGFAERAGGTLEIESEPGFGTTVTLWLTAITLRRPAEAVGSS